MMSQVAADLQSLYLCYPSRENLLLRMRAFIDFILERIKKDCFSMGACNVRNDVGGFFVFMT